MTGDDRSAPLAVPIAAGQRCGSLVGLCQLTADVPGVSVVDAARLLADWRDELGYLQLADALQMLRDAFGDRFVRPAAPGHERIRCDVLAALQTLAPGTEWANDVGCWES